MIMPVYSSGSRPAWSPSRVFRLAYFDARPEARIQAVYDGRCPRDEAAQEEEEAAARICYGYSTVGTVLYSLGLFYPFSDISFGMCWCLMSWVQQVHNAAVVAMVYLQKHRIPSRNILQKPPR